MNDEPLLKDRILKQIKHRGVEDGIAETLRDEIVGLYNEHSVSTAMLNWREKDRLKRLEHLQGWLVRRRDMRDEAKEEELRKSLGDRYRDYLSSEISACEWAIKFVKEHSI